MSTFQDMVDYLDCAYPARDQIVPCLVGPVGIGKTAAVRQHAENVGAGKVVTIIASQILPNEVSGITMPDSDTKAMEIYDHFRLSGMEDGDILFFDELLEADQIVLKACLTLIESRELMSGRKLPDVQIVAATNPSIKSTMLQENIRQRFVFRLFSVDKRGCARYIRKKYGIDVPGDVLNMIRSTGDDYNILTQRSLTKMVGWLHGAKDKDERKLISEQIDNIWNSALGTLLYREFERVDKRPDQARRAIDFALKNVYGFDRANNEDIASIVADASSVKDDIDLTIITDDDKFENASFEEIIGVLTSLPDWDKIENILSHTAINEDDEYDEVKF